MLAVPARHPAEAHTSTSHAIGVGDAASRQAGEAALRALYAEHAGVLLAYSERFTGDRGLAEEIVQETFLRAWRHLDRLQADPRPPRVWLLHVARNLLTDAARAAQTRPAPPLARTVPAIEPRFDGGLSQLVDHSELADALRRLSPAHRQVVIATFYHDEPLTATAHRLGVPAGTVRSRLHYALRELRALLAVDGPLAA
jgi:RNA polymerase sigma-70 factor (ECF subfamily)